MIGKVANVGGAESAIRDSAKLRYREVQLQGAGNNGQDIRQELEVRYDSERPL